jgi:hypothetical protein
MDMAAAGRQQLLSSVMPKKVYHYLIEIDNKKRVDQS